MVPGTCIRSASGDKTEHTQGNRRSGSISPKLTFLLQHKRLADTALKMQCLLKIAGQQQKPGHATMRQPFGVAMSIAPVAGDQLCCCTTVANNLMCPQSPGIVQHRSEQLRSWSRRLCSAVNPAQPRDTHGVPRRLPATSSAAAGRWQLWQEGSWARSHAWQKSQLPWSCSQAG